MLAQDVVAVEARLNQDPTRDQLMEMLVAVADGLGATALKRVSTHNYLVPLMGRIIDRLIEPAPERLLRGLVHHPHPRVFRSACAQYYWNFDADAAEAMAQAIADANPEPSPLGNEARSAVRAYARNREWGNTPSARVAAEPKAPFVPTPAVTPVVVTFDRGQLEALALENGGEALVPALSKVAWPSLRLVRTPAEDVSLRIGGSKLGGCPDMPATQEWPRFQGNPLSFIAQIDLADIAGFTDFTHLPDSGRLLFFYDADLQPWGHEGLEPGSSRVIYLPSGEALERRPHPHDLYDELRFSPAALGFLEDTTLPSPFNEPMLEAPGFGTIGLAWEQVEALDRLRDSYHERRVADNQPRHRMFGFPDAWQDGMYIDWESEQGDAATSEDRWRLLIQIDSDYVDTEGGTKGMFWGSGGRIYFWINRDALLHLDFTNPQVILQCT